MEFDKAKIGDLLLALPGALGSPLAQLIAPLILNALPTFGTISEADLAELRDHAAGYDRMAAEARRRAAG